jgi:hypothetical protein
MQTCRSKNSSLVIHKRDSKISSLLEVVWQHNWLFVGSGLVAKIVAYSKYVCKGVAAELAACWKVHKGVMAELAPRFSGRNLGNGYALFGIGLAAIIFGASLPPRCQMILKTGPL